MKVLLHSLLAAAAIVVATPASAQFAKPEAAVKYRQSVMALMGNHAGRINAQLKSDKPNFQAIQSSAALMETLTKYQFEGFIPGSDLVANTNAKPEIWSNQAKFNDYAKKLQGEVVKLSSTARGGDVKAIQAQFGEVGKACKSCHDDFQKEQ